MHELVWNNEVGVEIISKPHITCLFLFNAFIYISTYFIILPTRPLNES